VAPRKAARPASELTENGPHVDPAGEPDCREAIPNRPNSQVEPDAEAIGDADPLAFHPLSEIFPLIEGAEFDALVEDIRQHGLRELITVDHDEAILDGRNRYRACLAAGITPLFEFYKGDDPAGFVFSKNIVRRHLTAEQKRDLIGKLLKATPEKSNRQIAETVKASPTTVGTVRAKLEAAGDVCKLDTRTDKAGRAQPARKPKPEPEPKKFPHGDVELTPRAKARLIDHAQKTFAALNLGAPPGTAVVPPPEPAPEDDRQHAQALADRAIVALDNLIDAVEQNPAAFEKVDLERFRSQVESKLATLRRRS
jgi:hypothetical protein